MGLKISHVCAMVCPMVAQTSTPFMTSQRGLTPTRLRGVWPGLLLLSAAAAASACKGSAETAQTSAIDEKAHPLGVLELPVALRTHDTAPANAHELEATTDQVRVNSTAVINLQKGFV